MRRRMMRGAGAALATLTVAGCTPAFDGLTGVTVDEDGRPIIVAARCEGSINRMYLMAGRLDDRSADGYEVAWDATTPDDDPIRLAPWGDHPGWTLGKPLGAHSPQPPPPLQSGYSYSFHAVYTGFLDTTYAQHARFTVEDLAALEPGQVRFVGWGPERDVRVLPEEDFLREPRCPPSGG